VRRYYRYAHAVITGIDTIESYYLHKISAAFSLSLGSWVIAGRGSWFTCSCGLS
jgi:hypothetical protein